MTTVAELKEIAKKRGLSGYSKLRKDKLIKLLGISVSRRSTTRRSVSRRSVSRRSVSKRSVSRRSVSKRSVSKRSVSRRSVSRRSVSRRSVSRRKKLSLKSKTHTKMTPHDRSNRITDDYKIVVGAKPIQETLENILKFDIIVNLTDDEWYKKYITKNTYINLPIKNGGVPTKKDAECLVDLLIDNYNKGKSIYIHCNGGHGRAGTIGAALLGKLYSLDANEAINRIIKYREERKDKSRNFIPTPETQAQVNLLMKMLGGDIIPDRKDKSWLKRVKKEREVKKETEDKIFFYTDDKVYPQFSNYFVHDITIDGVVYKSSEHAFQCKKFLYKGASKTSRDYAEVIRNIKTPNMSRILASQKKMGGYAWTKPLNVLIDEYKSAKIDPNWDENRVDVMYNILRHKFQDPKLREILLSTGDKEIVEHTSRDKFWADGGDGSGKNMLGKLLVKVREELKE